MTFHPWMMWVLGGLVLLGAELLLPGVFLIWVGLAAMGTGLLVAAVDVPFAFVAAAFLLQLAVGIGLGVLSAKEKASGRGIPNTPGAGLLGRQGTVLAEEPVGLRVRIGDSDWPARWAAGQGGAAPGEAVRVEAIEGMTLVVAPLQ